MKKDNLLIALGAFAVLLCGTAIASAGTIPPSTGFGVYTFSGPGPVSGTAVIPTSVPGQWATNPNDAFWIAPSYDQSFNNPYVSGGSPTGDYTYTTTFSVSLADPNTAVLAGYWSTDNGGTMYLNGNPVASLVPSPYPPNTYGNLWSFVITSGFQAGTNTLTFVVNNEAPDGPFGPAGPSPWAGPNGENPTGLIVEFTQASVPEPTLILLLGIGLGAVTLLARRWRI